MDEGLKYFVGFGAGFAIRKNSAIDGITGGCLGERQIRKRFCLSLNRRWDYARALQDVWKKTSPRFQLLGEKGKLQEDLMGYVG